MDIYLFIYYCFNDQPGIFFPLFCPLNKYLNWFQLKEIKYQAIRLCLKLENIENNTVFAKYFYHEKSQSGTFGLSVDEENSV